VSADSRTGPSSVASVPDRLRSAAELFEGRNRVYGGNYRNFGAVMAAMYPAGLLVLTEEEWTRLILQVHRVTKETRYATNFGRGGHADSLEDLCVYAQMAAEMDELARPAAAHRAALSAERSATPSAPEAPPVLCEADEWTTIHASPLPATTRVPPDRASPWP
jgi:hypothetical protein